jgi:hypothetical protein
VAEDFTYCDFTLRIDCNFEKYTSLPLSHRGVKVVREEGKKEEGRIKIRIIILRIKILYTPA